MHSTIRNCVFSLAYSLMINFCYSAIFQKQVSLVWKISWAQIELFYNFLELSPLDSWKKKAQINLDSGGRRRAKSAPLIGKTIFSYTNLSKFCVVIQNNNNNNFNYFDYFYKSNNTWDKEPSNTYCKKDGTPSIQRSPRNYQNRIQIQLVYWGHH